MIETTNPEIDVNELMERMRKEAGKIGTRNNVAAMAANPHRSVPSAPLPSVPEMSAPPVLGFSAPLDPEMRRTGARLEKTRGMIEVSSRIPKMFRSLFRRQGGFNRAAIETLNELAKTNLRLNKRVHELTAAAEQQNQWLQLLASQQHGLRNWLRAATTFLTKVPTLEDQTNQWQTRQEEQLRNLQAHNELEFGRVAEMQTKINTYDDVMNAIRHSLSAEERAREEVEKRAQDQHLQLLRFGETLEALSGGLQEEAEARKTAEGRAQKNEEELDLMRQSHAQRREETNSSLTFLRNLVVRLDERLVADSSYLKRELHLQAQRIASAPEALSIARGGRREDGRISEKDALSSQELDAFYLAFEDQFRGSRTMIKNRVSVYLPSMLKAEAGNEDSPILDLGSGRGEWLELLKEKNLVAHGVDLNAHMVAECVERGLRVEMNDALDYLAALPSASQGAVTAFHVIEHLPYPILLKLFAESLRVLRVGGVCIFETPNPDNVLVGSNRFYTDPTHLHPLPSNFSRFIALQVGFHQVDILPLHADESGPPLDAEATPLERLIHQSFFGPQDYAVIGRK